MTCVTSTLNNSPTALPHTSIPSSSFYKHIDADLPESLRLRQLLIWCAYRSMTAPPLPSSTLTPKSKSKQPLNTAPDPSLPTLTPQEAKFLREMQEEVIKRLAEGKIDTTLSSQSGGDVRGKGKSKEEAKTWRIPNEQNVKNRQREVEFKECIAR
jgi:kinetochore protein Mis13/DSN1